MQTTLINSWIEALDAFDVPWRETIVLVGEDSGQLAAACMARGSAPPLIEANEFTVLSRDEIDSSDGSWHGVSPQSAAVVVLRRAWRTRTDLAVAAATAARLLAPGGRLMAADFDLDRLLGGSPVYYPYSLRFLGDPVAAEWLRSSTMPPGAVAVEATRVGLADLESFDLDEERARYGSVREYWEAVRDGAWPSLAEMPEERRGPYLEWLGDELRSAIPLGGVVDRRPWFVVTGRKR